MGYLDPKYFDNLTYILDSKEILRNKINSP